MPLLDWYKTFPKVWGILGWHIQLYHTHMTVTPPAEPHKTLEKDGPGLGFHQDSGRINSGLRHESASHDLPHNRLFLTDTTEQGRGNFYVLPKSQTQNTFPGENRQAPHKDSIPVLVPPDQPYFSTVAYGTPPAPTTGRNPAAYSSTATPTAGFAPATTCA